MPARVKDDHNLQRDTLIKMRGKHKQQALIDLKIEYSEKSHLLTSYVNKLVSVNRIYPNHLPTQSSFRWSTTHPPLTNFPRACINPHCSSTEHEWDSECWSLRDIVLADPNEVLVTWDHDNIEGRIHDLYLDDVEALEAHAMGFDLHTITCCAMFGMDLPFDLRNPHSSVEDAAWRARYNWQGKDTQRRVMAKNFNHGSKYTVNPRFVYSIPNIEKYGLSRQELIEMAEAYMESKRLIFIRKKRVMNAIKRNKIARNLYGAKRVFYDSSEDTGKEGFSFVISSTVSLYNNETLIMLKQCYGDAVRLIHNAHDGDKVCFVRGSVPSLAELRNIIERPMQWKDKEVMLTAGVKVYE